MISDNKNQETKRPKIYKKFRPVLTVGIIILTFIIGYFVYKNWIQKSNSVSVENGSSSNNSSSPLVSATQKQTKELTALNAQLSINPAPAEQVQFTNTAKARLDNINRLLAKEQVKEVLDLAQPDGFKNAPKSAEPYLEKRATIKGKLFVIHGENFDKKGVPIEGSEVHEFWVGKKAPLGKRLFLTGDLADSFPNSTISTQTIQFGTSYAADSGSVTQTAAAPVAAAPAQMKIAVVLLHLPGSSAEPFTPLQAQNIFFAQTSSVLDQYREQSGGQTQVTGQVFGWWDGSSGVCSVYNETTDAKTALSAHGIDYSSYTNIVALTPGTSCAYAGEATVGGIPGLVHLNGANLSSVAEHELGHNLGNYHAGQYSCISQTSSCLWDYGDPYDVMGSGQSRHFNAYHKYVVGWLPASETKTFTSGTNTVTLTPEENPNVPGSTELVFVQAPSGPKYAVEYRQSFGYDSGISGVWVRRVEHVNTDDVTMPYQSKVVAAGQQFVDVDNKVIVKTISDNTTNASVQISIGVTPTGCLTSDPLVGLLLPSSQTGNPGQSLSYTLSLVNRDIGTTCSPSSFAVSSTIAGPNSFISQTPSSTNITAAPGATVNTPINITSASNTPPGTTCYFKDTVSGAGRNSLEANGGYATAGTATYASDTLLINPSATVFLPGTTQSYTATITNKGFGNCASTLFTLGFPALPAGFSQIVNGASSMALIPGANGIFNFSITSPIFQTGINNSITETITATGHSNSTGNIPVNWPFLTCGHC